MSREAMKQPEALRLADALDDEFTQGRISNHTGRKAAAELRRLHAENEALREALQAIVDDATPWGNQAANMAHIARAALARAGEVK